MCLSWPTAHAWLIYRHGHRSQTSQDKRSCDTAITVRIALPCLWKEEWCSVLASKNDAFTEQQKARSIKG